jgi:zinc finger CCHC domain-containing protein 8
VLIDIKFRNKKTYFALHEEFIDVVKKYYRSKLDDMDILDDATNHKVSVSEKIVKKSESFLIDTTPKAINENEQTPRYTSLNTPVLSNSKKIIEESFIAMTSGQKCFNCDQDTHGLRDCPEPRNMGKIRRARNEFNRKELRYHDDEDQFVGLVPGSISDDLKQALGLSGNEIPLHVYKMRLYGYPPGWLEDAKVQHSGLALFTGKENEQTDEEKTFKYDVQKIHDFPGFNIQPEGQFVDRHRFYQTPPMLPQQSKDFLIESLGENVVNGYKKRKLKENQGDSTFCDNVEMEIASDDEEVLPLGRTIYPNQEPSPPGEDFDGIPPPPESPESPEDGELLMNSTSELEAKRQQLMDEIASTDLISKNCIDENSVNENRDNSSKDITVGHVATTVFGTPVLDSFSGFEALPDGDNFMVGVSEVINFENLAESTGKYENMRELIKKVRVFQKKQQE